MKKKIGLLIPVQPIWLQLPDAAKFMGMSTGTFKKFGIENGLSVSFIGHKIYYKVEEINLAIENNVMVKGTIRPK